ncbi:hypothetical protein [Subtercola lobariae]|uniref:Uncharacterized protein n=1 Tax=Subtercola lobariae TaxID=1588641 RepID=A0A917BBI7_9MICO|nr:hypothetical protein [Subtercola lobariae]GGF35984.1 hypothetical protein GCM10011399_31190 [Subtercola lobariae]
MVFLIVLGVIGLVGVVASVFAIAGGGYSGVRTRDDAHYRSTFDHAAFHARPVPAGFVPLSTAPDARAALDAPSSLGADAALTAHTEQTAQTAHTEETAA